MSSSTLEPGMRLAKYDVVAHVATGGTCDGNQVILYKTTRDVTITSQAGLLRYRDHQCANYGCSDTSLNIIEWTAWDYDGQSRITDVSHSDGT